MSDLRSQSVARGQRTCGPGTVTLITGCMFSGKTTELLRRVDRAPPGRAIVFKHVIDTRYAMDAVVSHAGQSCPAVVVDGSGALRASLSGDLQLVAVDEAHFFDVGILAVVSDLRHRGIDAVLTALNLDSWGRPFPVVGGLAEMAAAVVPLTAICSSCGRRADRTQRTTPIVDGDHLGGGAESYQPRCGRCWRPPGNLPC